MLGRLELYVDVDDFVSKDEILLIAFHPGRLWPILDLTNLEAGEDELRVYFGGVFCVDFLAVRH